MSAFGRLATIMAMLALCNSSSASFAQDEGTSGNANFSDIDAYWGKPYVRSLAKQGIIAGFPDGTFQPDAFVTRAQFAAMLVHGMQLEPDFGGAPFADVKAKNWAAPAIAAVAKAGYVGGFPDGTFHPDDKITRAQALVILAKTLPERKADDERHLEAYKDSTDVPRWAMADVAKAATDRIIVDYPDPTVIRAQDNATRGELAGLLYQTMRRLGADLPPIKIGLLPEEHPVVQAQVKPEQKLNIAAVQVSPAGFLRAGKRVSIVVRGTPGATASYSIAGIATNMAMNEHEPGVYTATYVVGPADARTNAFVLAQLEKDGNLVKQQANTALNFDAVPPSITRQFPPPNSVTGNPRPSIGASFTDRSPGIDPSRVVLFVNGQNVTGRSRVTNSGITFMPPFPLSSRNVSVRLIICDLAGNSQTASWNFMENNPVNGGSRPYGPTGYYGSPYPYQTPQQQEKWMINHTVNQTIDRVIDKAL